MRDLKYDEIYMNLMSKTWEKDTNGLFDYCCKDALSFNSSIYDSMNIIRKGQEIKQDVFEEKGIENIEHLFYVKKENEKYIIENEVEINMEQNEKNINKINNNFWYVIHNKNKKYFLLKNDIIKLGRIKYFISEDSIYSGDTKYELSIPKLESVSKINKQNERIGNPFNLITEYKTIFDKDNTPKEKGLCKICYSEEIEPLNNPMVHLCNCKGYINYAHFNCIKYWMKTKLIIKENEKKTVKTYFIPQFNCEICKVAYPYKFKLDKNGEQIYELIDIERPNCNYIILESLNQIKENNGNHKFIHVIKLINEEDITIGRSNKADLKISDISVSRIHAKLKFNFESKSLEISDLNSKFGTLVLIKDKIELKSGERLITQVGRTLFGVNVIKKEEEKIKEEKNNSLDEEDKLSKENINNNKEMKINNINVDKYKAEEKSNQ